MQRYRHVAQRFRHDIGLAGEHLYNLVYRVLAQLLGDPYDTRFGPAFRTFAVMFAILFWLVLQAPRGIALSLWVVPVLVAFGSIAYLTFKRNGWRTPSGLSIVAFFGAISVELIYIVAVGFGSPRLPPLALATVYATIGAAAAVAVKYYPWRIPTDPAEPRDSEGPA